MVHLSQISQDGSNILIQASKIKLEGLVTANNNFKILADGSIEAKNGKFTGAIEATSGKIGDFTIENGKLVVTYSWFTYVGPNTVQVTQKTTFQPSGVLVEASYGGTFDHPQVISWNAKFDSGGVTVGSMELRRDGLYRNGIFCNINKLKRNNYEDNRGGITNMCPVFY